MVRAEDKQFEKEILKTHHHIVVPIELSVADGEIDILAYSFCMEIAREFEDKFSADPFSHEAKAFLSEKISPIMDELDYESDVGTCRIHLEYRCSSPNKAKILPQCEIIDTLDGVEYHQNLPLDEFELDPTYELDRMAVIRDGGSIVAFAGVNDISADNGFAEITVECAEEYRHRGYGVSCVAKLTEYLISIGERVQYICSDTNEASKKTAEAAGYTLYKKVLPFVCYSKETDD